MTVYIYRRGAGSMTVYKNDIELGVMQRSALAGMAFA